MVGKKAETPKKLKATEVTNQQEEQSDEGQKEKEVQKTKADVLKRGCGCCDVKLSDLPPGQRYFEAPDGHLIIGEQSLTQIWDRRGKGSWINPLR